MRFTILTDIYVLKQDEKFIKGYLLTAPNVKIMIPKNGNNNIQEGLYVIKGDLNRISNRDGLTFLFMSNNYTLEPKK